MARTAGADDDDVLSQISTDLKDARTRAADAAEAFASLCRSGSPPRQLHGAATSAYLTAGRVIALSSRLS